mmetsp:Transcript_64159/g.180585  ORF Transcript_64159/g.180585 Transcript_64159/m.180585 type:complete len:249 (+) Transcript_64159:66-812(+)
MEGGQRLPPRGGPGRSPGARARGASHPRQAPGPCVEGVLQAHARLLREPLDVLGLRPPQHALREPPQQRCPDASPHALQRVPLPAHLGVERGVQLVQLAEAGRAAVQRGLDLLRQNHSALQLVVRSEQAVEVAELLHEGVLHRRRPASSRQEVQRVHQVEVQVSPELVHGKVYIASVQRALEADPVLLLARPPHLVKVGQQVRGLYQAEDGGEGLDVAELLGVDQRPELRDLLRGHGPVVRRGAHDAV